MPEADSSRADGGFGAWLHRLSAWFAIGGGLMLAAMVLLVVVSVLGRALFLRPVPGDFEIVGLGTGIAIFLFLPYCYLQRGNVAVDIFVRNLPAGVQRATDSLAAIVFALVGGLFAWRMLFGLFDTYRYEDISMIVGVPIWWVYPFAVASFALLCLSAAYTAVHGWPDESDE